MIERHRSTGTGAEISDNPILRDIVQRGLSREDTDAPNVHHLWTSPDTLSERYPTATPDEVAEAAWTMAVVCDHEGGVWPGIDRCADCGAKPGSAEREQR